MVITTALGVGCLGVAGYEIAKQMGDDTKHILLQAMYEAELYNQHRKQDGKRVIQQCKITAFYKEPFGYDITVRLPVGLGVSKIRSQLEILEMALDAEIKVESSGQYVRLLVGKLELSERMNYRDGLIKFDGLQIPLFSRFGIETIDFNSEIGAHVLIAGASGMGKSKLLDLILTLIILQTNGAARIYLINNKMVDTFAYRNLPNVTIHESLKESEAALEEAIEEMEDRKKKMVKAGAVKTSEYTEEVLPPWFVTIDEYARFSDSKEFQSKVVEIAERGRSFDIHLVLATQRPDAAEVLNPRIKANCMTKIALKTTTSSNSRVILESEDAFKLPEIQGRAILQKSGNKTVQVPFLSAEQQALLLKPFYQKAGAFHDRKGPEVIEISRKVSRSKSGSNRKTGLQRYSESIGDSDKDL